MYASDLVMVSNLFSRLNHNGLEEEFKVLYPRMKFFSEKDREDYPGLIKKIVEDIRPKALILNSGDGGTHVFLSVLFSMYEPGDPRIPPLVVLPGGTINVHASAVGHRGVLLSRPKAIMEQVIGSRYLAEGNLETLTSNLLSVDDGEIRRVGCTVANGAVSRYFEEYIHDSGFWKAVGQIGKRSSVFVLRELFQERYGEYFPLEEMAFGWEGKEVRDNFHGFAAYSVPFGIVGFHLPHEGEGLHVLATDFEGRRKFLRNFVGGVTGTGYNFEVDASMERLVVENPGVYVFDGDLYHANRLEISTIPVTYVKL
ncbi:hypothetical protein HOD38_00915 [archaeon]|jgi:hypothetical protein|nr:hypothetical protein [archaeon]MBT4396807.1 hypothetical protein [archaeon]MBT4441515.1 hypothetical protein [archaeon]